VFCCYVSSSCYSSPYTDYCIFFALFPYRILNSASYAGLEHWKQAADDAKACIRIDPYFVQGYYRSAVAQITLGEHDSAIAMIRQGLVVDSINLPLTKLLRKAQQQKKVGMARQQSNLVNNDNAARGAATSQLRIPNIDGMTLDRVDAELTNATEIRMYAQQQQKKEVDRYNQILMTTMSMTDSMMKMDPKQSENPADFTTACDLLRRLHYRRIPPSIHKELLPCLPDVIRRHAPLVELVQVAIVSWTFECPESTVDAGLVDGDGKGSIYDRR
jgi:hypothetical protein